MGAYVYPRYAARRAAELDRATPARHRVVVVGAGPVGLTVAIDLARRGIAVTLLDEDDTVSVGSRGLCYAQRSLEIWDRLGCVGPMMGKGVTWRRGRVFLGDAEAYAFDLQPEGRHRFPAFINLQQYWLEQFLVEAAGREARIDLRWRSQVVGATPLADGVRLEVETPDGRYALEAEWLLACDGARSPLRRAFGLPFVGQVFEDRFLIADVEMDVDLPAERRFWFDPPFHAGRSALLHKQADGQWRVDFQLGWDADPEEEKKPERIVARLARMFGPGIDFTIRWASVYTFQCRRLERFRHGRAIFLGDAAHQVSPFGARGGNSGVQDADNLAWKLALVLAGRAPERLLDSYDAERVAAADENIAHSTRATDFISPKGDAALAYRDAALELARMLPFARRLVNSGRLSTATAYRDSPLSTPDRESWAGGVAPGAAAVDVPLADGSWLLARLAGGGFAALVFADDAPALGFLRHAPVPIEPVVIPRALDADGLARRRYAADEGAVHLLRPDQHVAGRWRGIDPPAVAAALARALAA